MPEYRLTRFRGKFAVVWHDGGRRFRHSLGVDGRADADRRLAQFIAAQTAARSVGRSSLTVAEAWSGYVASLGSKPSAVTASHQWKAIAPSFADRDASTLTEDDCNRYVDARRKLGRSDSTIWSELSRLRSALRWAEKKRLIDKAPFIWKPAQSPPRDKRLTREEVTRLIAACEYPHVKLFVILAITTAARMTAILELEWSRVDLQRGLISYQDPTIAKTTKGRATVPINTMAHAALTEAQRGATTPFVIEWAGQRVRSVKKALASASERAEIGHVSAHMLRHSAASILVESGATLFEVAKLLGHSNTKMIETTYAHLAPDYLRGAASKLEF
jgi:integrase